MSDSRFCGNYWYVVMAGDSNFVVDEATAKELSDAMLMGLCAVKITDLVGSAMVVTVGRIETIEESTPELRDAAYEWNRTSDAEKRDRTERLGGSFE